MKNINRTEAWKSIVGSLRKEFMQGNSHINGIHEIIDEWVAEAIDEMRMTGKTVKTKNRIAKITWKY